MGIWYGHLSEADREKIFLQLSEGKSRTEIALILGYHKSTISREIRRGCVVTKHRKPAYLASEAQKRAVVRKKKSRKVACVEKFQGLARYIEERIHAGWSPEQISGFMKRDWNFKLSHESIYRFVYSREGVQKRLGKYLRQPKLLRCHHHHRRPKKTHIVDRIDISLRPPEVATRQEFGHWEGDTMAFMGHKQALATHVERKSRYIMARPVKDQKAATRTDNIAKIFKPLPSGTAKTFTFDNGSEFAEHKNITAATGASIYFAQPYKAWQKGSIENANGLIRWYLPRMTNLKKLEPWKLDGIIHLLNNRPRKCLNFRTPAEVFAEEIQKLI